jgi:phosphohistidine phosphatase
VILTSPYKRALQTARLAAKILEGPEPLVCGELVPDGTPRGLWNEIRSHPDAAHLMLAGHEPLFSQSVSYLLGAPALTVEMKKGAMAAIEFHTLRGEPRGTLQWMLIPRLCQ